jgi:hypothetical protein
MNKCVVVFLLLAVTAVGSAQPQKFRSGIFLHHSTGYRIWGPNDSPTSVQQEIETYNRTHGFSDSDALTLAEQWWPPTPDNEWSRWHEIFDNADPDADLRYILAANKIVMIKSCFPSSSMWGGTGSASDTLTPQGKSIYNYKWHWRSMVSVMRTLPDNFFVIWTNAPLAPGVITIEEAIFSDRFCRWAKDTLAAGLDPVFGPFPKNVFVFDFFHKLAGSDGRLPIRYAVDSTDSHPNSAATQLVTPQLVREMFDAAIAYEQYAPIIVKHYPVISLATTHLAMDPTPIGASRDTAITIGNMGSDTLKITSITPSNGMFYAWPIVKNIPPGHVTHDSIRFTPSALGRTSATLLIASNDTSSPHSLNLSGIGYGTPLLAVGPPSVNFGSVRRGQFKDTTISVRNIGNDTLRVKSITPGTTDFSVRPTTVVIAPGGTFADTVSIQPGRFGSFIDSLVVQSDGGANIIRISAESPYPSLACSPSALDFGPVRTDTSVRSDIIMTNTSINTLQIDSITLSGTHFIARITAAPLFLTQKDTAILTVAFAPDSVDTYIDTLFIYSNQFISYAAIPLTGKAVPVTSVAGALKPLPATFVLESNFPNPFNPSTTLTYGLPRNSRVRLEIFNILGQLVAEVVNGERDAGWHHETWNAAAATGVYICRFEATGLSTPKSTYVQVRKLLLLK